MASTYVQFRADSSDKKKATEILNALGTNLSAVLNMTLKQIIIQQGIPFKVALPQDHAVQNVAASMAIEGMDLSEQKIQDLANFRAKTPEQQEQEIQQIIGKYQEKEDIHG